MEMLTEKSRIKEKHQKSLYIYITLAARVLTEDKVVLTI